MAYDENTKPNVIISALYNLLEKVFNSIDNYLTVGVKGSVGYENYDGYDFFKQDIIGTRMKQIINYNSTLGTSSSYTSASFTAQDGGQYNYKEIRVFLYQEGSTDTDVIVQQSPDNSNWYDIASANNGGSAVTTLKVDIYLPYVRVVEKNNDGTNAQSKNVLFVYLVP